MCNSVKTCKDCVKMDRSDVFKCSVQPEIRFRFRSIRSFFSDPVPVRFRPNTDRIDRIWLSPGKNAFINLGVGFDIM